MRKRLAVAVIALAFTSSAIAAETKRYIVGTKRAFSAGALQAVRDSVEGVELASRDVAGFEVMRGFAADLTDEEAATLRASREVRWVEPVAERHAFDVARNLGGQTTPHGVLATGALMTWAAHATGTVNVVVIDTGVDYHHEELKAIYAGGHNVIASSDDPADDNGHGTHVAGTIAAADNTVGVVGLAPSGIRLWAVKVLNSGGSGTTEGIYRGLDWVVEKKRELGGNWVVNLSLGAKSEAPGEREAFQSVADEGILVVAATGNASTASNVAPVAFPAALPSVIAVGAVDDRRHLATFSGQGPEIDFTAPGVRVLSTVPRGSRFLSYIKDGSNVIETDAVIGSATGTITADYVYCGVGKPEEFPANMQGKIAVIKRGADISFANKTRAAKAAGAVAVAIFNHDNSANSWTLFSDEQANNESWPIVLRVTKEDGDVLAEKRSGRLTIANEPDDYAELSGTSMATPHVTAAVAMLWTLAPNATPQTIVNALTQTAFDLGKPGHDSQFGAGAINIFDAARFLAPETFPTGPTTGRGIGRR